VPLRDRWTHNHSLSFQDVSPMKRLLMPSFSALAFGIGNGACDEVEHPETPYASGGGLTVFDRSSNGFGGPGPSLDALELAAHFAGDAAFEAVFVTAPAPINPGLGPTFNNTSCNSCHPRDGRGLAIAGGPPLFSPLLVRVSLAEGEPEVPGGVVPVPGLGTQVQDHAVYGQSPEAKVVLTWKEIVGEFGDGTPFSLRQPIIEMSYPDGTPVGDEVLMSGRIPPPVFGLGLLEAIPAEVIEALADPEDDDGDGISGRANHVWDAALGEPVLGRFGWKANTADLERQVAAAYADDMGISNPLHPADDGTMDIDQATIDANRFYISTLGVPAPHDGGPEARRGAKIFQTMGCAGCHVESVETGAHEIAALSFQSIRPFSDMLLHDMGPGLADGRPDWEASGSEWRTAPLWGVGLTATVLPLATFLHDGRARTLAEAVLWHGGEAEKSREAFRKAPKSERDALMAFLRSL